ncbi:hypothetical protein A2U01_0074948, partial [Trifolium medium]|nr:hypothetical protein [Trifolium medium]
MFCSIRAGSSFCSCSVQCSNCIPSLFVFCPSLKAQTQFKHSHKA